MLPWWEKAWLRFGWADRVLASQSVRGVVPGHWIRCRYVANRLDGNKPGGQLANQATRATRPAKGRRKSRFRREVYIY